MAVADSVNKQGGRPFSQYKRKSTGMVLFLILATCVSASVLPGTRMNVDWENLISGQDIILTLPAPNVKNGLLLGNGDIGVSLYGPPERLTLHIGKNDIWDYRDGVYRLMKTQKPITQKQIMDLYTDPNKSDDEVDKELHRIGDPWGQAKNGENKQMPKIAGQIRFVNKALEGSNYVQRLHLYDAEVTGKLGQASTQVFVAYNRNLIAATYTPDSNQAFDIEMVRNKVAANKDFGMPEFGVSGNDMWVRYKFPADEASYAFKNGFEYVMYARIVGDNATIEKKEVQAVAHLSTSKPITLFVGVATTRDAADPFAAAKMEVEQAVKTGLSNISKQHKDAWHDFWQKSFFQIPENPFMTRYWFLCNYHLASCVKVGKIAPGLYGPWVEGDWSGWYGGYTWDYNFRQPFWAAFTSNHVEQTAPFVETIYSLLPGAKNEAKNIYGLDGAVYPMVSWPGVTDYNPYVLCHDWKLSRCMCLSAWSAQDMWRYYQYSQDKEFLREKGYPVMKECVTFYEGFLTKAMDGKYDVFPTVSPEHWGMDRSLRYNKNCTIDLALIRCLMNNCIKASEIMGVDEKKRPIWKHIAENLREYPTAQAQDGNVFLDVENAPFPYITYNLPVPAMAVFPGDDIGLYSDEKVKGTAFRTVKYLYLSLSNNYIIGSMIKVRLGVNVLDDEFERYTKWLWRSNGTTYDETLLQDVWVENFGAPLVYNESVLQSYTGFLRIAPVKLGRAVRFFNLRAENAFLVSSEIKAGGKISYITITSEAGNTCKLFRPWEGVVRIRDAGTMAELHSSEARSIITFATTKGGTYIVDSPENPWEKQLITTISADEAKPQPAQWQLIATSVGLYTLYPYSFVYIPGQGAALHNAELRSDGKTVWQLQLAPIASSKYRAIEALVSGTENTEISLEVKDAGCNQIAKLDSQKCSIEKQKLSLKLPSGKFIGAVTIGINSSDKKRADLQVRSLRFVSDDGSAADVDLSAIDIYKGTQPHPISGQQNN